MKTAMITLIAFCALVYAEAHADDCVNCIALSKSFQCDKQKVKALQIATRKLRSTIEMGYDNKPFENDPIYKKSLDNYIKAQNILKKCGELILCDLKIRKKKLLGEGITDISTRDRLQLRRGKCIRGRTYPDNMIHNSAGKMLLSRTGRTWNLNAVTKCLTDENDAFDYCEYDDNQNQRDHAVDLCIAPVSSSRSFQFAGSKPGGKGRAYLLVSDSLDFHRTGQNTNGVTLKHHDLDDANRPSRKIDFSRKNNKLSYSVKNGDVIFKWQNGEKLFIDIKSGKLTDTTFLDPTVIKDQKCLTVTDKMGASKWRKLKKKRVGRKAHRVEFVPTVKLKHGKKAKVYKLHR